MLKDAAAIVGIAETPFAKRLEASEKALALQAILGALDDAGIAPSEVDGLASYTMEATDEVEVAKNLGAGDVTFFSQVGYGGGAGPATVGQLALAIAAGQCRVGVAWRARKRGSDFRAADIRVAQIYDAFTPRIPLSLEGYGFCGRGEGAAFTEGGALEMGGRLPINTSGGGLSEAYVHGFNLINEGVRRGELRVQRWVLAGPGAR